MERSKAVLRTFKPFSSRWIFSWCFSLLSLSWWFDCRLVLCLSSETILCIFCHLCVAYLGRLFCVVGPRQGGLAGAVNRWWAWWCSHNVSCFLSHLPCDWQARWLVSFLMGQGELARTGLPCLAYCIYCGVGIHGGNRVHIQVEQICITYAISSHFYSINLCKLYFGYSHLFCSSNDVYLFFLAISP